MTSETPPSEYFTGINFNSSFYTEEPITEGEGDKRYLIKTQSDSTFAGRQTFNTEIATTNFSWTRGIAVVSSIPEYNPGGAYLTLLLGILAEMDSSGRIYGQAFEIVNNAVLNTCTFSGLVTCNSITMGSVGGTTVTTANVPITLGHAPATSLSRLGGTNSVLSASAVSIASTPVTLISYTNIPVGVYQVFYEIFHTINTSALSFTEQQVVLCDTQNSLSTVFNRIFTIESNSSPGVSKPAGSFSITGGGILVNNTANLTAYLNVKYTFTGTGTLIAFGHIRLVRIG